MCSLARCSDITFTHCMRIFHYVYSSRELRFLSLERLWLDDNKLSDLATFATLAGLRK